MQENSIIQANCYQIRLKTPMFYTTVLKSTSSFQMGNQLRKEVEVSHRNVSLLKNALLLTSIVHIRSFAASFRRCNRLPSSVSKSNVLSTCLTAKKLPKNTISYISLTRFHKNTSSTLCLVGWGHTNETTCQGVRLEIYKPLELYSF